MAVWRSAQEPVEGPWEGFANAHAWIRAEHSWWQLIPRPVGVSAPAGGARLGVRGPCHVVTAYNPGRRVAADADNRVAAGLRCRLPAGWADGPVLLRGHPGGAWLEPGVAVIGLSRQQARALGGAYGRLALYELQGATRRVIASGGDDILIQTVVCHRGRQPPTPASSAPPQP